MPKTLERDLGLYAVITISIGAMIGSGIFVLPGLATTIAGPAVILAYLLAGLTVLPAALSKAEMATAMPEAGGTYIFIDRAMGPLLGTIAGIGAWFSLVFKSAFALVGLGAYLLLFADLPTIPVALALGVMLITVNILGVKQTGRLQAIIVTGVLGVLALFVANGVTFVENANYHPFFPEGTGGLFAAAGFVFVSYAGVTKIASVAEEVENPGRNLPLGMLISIGLMMAVYTLIVFVIVGVTEPGELGKTLTPMSDAAGQFLGQWGVVAIAVTAVLALTSMANAGILSSSRYPLAMSRNKLAPNRLKVVNERFSTPIYSILFTGGLMLALIAFVPVVDLAKLASAFQILVFCIINLAVIALRESDLEWYAPTFRAPWYPWVQLAGIAGGLALLTQMGTMPLIGAVAIIVFGVGWYVVYARQRTSREGAAVGAVRRAGQKRIARKAERAVAGERVYRVLVPLLHETPREREAVLMRIAADIVKPKGGTIEVMRFEEVPDQIELSVAVERVSDADVAFEEQTDAIAAALGVVVEAGEVVSHDTDRAVVNYARKNKVDLIVAEWEPGSRRLFPREAELLVKKAPCDVLFVEDRGIADIDDVVVLLDKGPADPLKLQSANAVAESEGAQVRLFSTVPEDASEAEFENLRMHHQELERLTTVRTGSMIIVTDARERTFVKAARDADLVVVSASEPELFHRAFSETARRIVREGDKSVLVVHAREPHHHTFLRRFVRIFTT